MKHFEVFNTIKYTPCKGESEKFLKKLYAERIGKPVAEVSNIIDELFNNKSLTMRNFGNGSVAFIACSYTEPAVKEEKPVESLETIVESDPKDVDIVEVPKVEDKPKTKRTRKPRTKKVVKED